MNLLLPRCGGRAIVQHGHLPREQIHEQEACCSCKKIYMKRLELETVDAIVMQSRGLQLKEGWL